MQLLVIVYVSEMARSVAFYESLGLEREDSREIDDYWNGFTVNGGKLALHWAMGDPLPPPSGRMTLNIDFAADGSLQRLHETCASIGYDPSVIGDEGFGRFFWTKDPDGLTIQFNERA